MHIMPGNMPVWWPFAALRVNQVSDVRDPAQATPRQMLLLPAPVCRILSFSRRIAYFAPREQSLCSACNRCAPMCAESNNHRKPGESTATAHLSAVGHKSKGMSQVAGVWTQSKFLEADGPNAAFDEATGTVSIHLLLSLLTLSRLPPDHLLGRSWEYYPCQLCGGEWPQDSKDCG